MSSFGTPSKNLSADSMATLSVGNQAGDGPSAGQSASDEHANNGLAADHAHTLIKAFENLIVPIIHSQVPASGSNINNPNRSYNLEAKAQQLLGALKTFVAALVRSELSGADKTDGNEADREPAAREERMTPRIVQPLDDRTIAVSGRNTSNSAEQLLLKLVLEDARNHIFNIMPIRLLMFKPDGSGIELIDRGSIWNRISTSIRADLNASNIKYTIQQLAAANSTDSMTEEQKQKAGIKFLVEKYTRYAILSHTWLHDTPGEVTYADWHSGKVSAHSRGYQKLVNFCRVAATDYGVQFGWMDTICINKESSSELDESIRSMFKWYRRSYRCITYLADTTALCEMHRDSWFTRGWTLQELIGPHYISFYGTDWQRIVPGLENDKTNRLILEEIQAATTITREELEIDRWTIPISRRMQWAAKRRVTRDEDTAYSLMGIFNDSISTAYGEGTERAFVRLVKEILTTRTPSVLDISNWGYGPEKPHGRTLERSSDLIPSSPREYLWRADRAIHWYRPINPIALTHLGLHIPVLLMCGASVDPPAQDDFLCIGNYYASVKDVTFSSQSGIICRDYHLLEKNPKRQNLSHSQIFLFFGVLNLLETTNTVELPARGGCFAVPLYIRPQPTTMGILPKEFTAQPFPTTHATVFDLKRFGTDSFVIPKNELGRHGMTLRTLYL